MKRLLVMLVIFMAVSYCSLASAEESKKSGGILTKDDSAKNEAAIKIAEGSIFDYVIGIDDIITINVLQPEKLTSESTVAPDGSVSFPYIGNVNVKGLTIKEAEDLIQSKLSEGYMKYPVVSISLRESRSKKFSVSGQVARPGTYPLEDNMTILKAISMAGGFVDSGVMGSVKILRPKSDGKGYETIETDINQVLQGSEKISNFIVKPNDAIVVYVDKFFVYGEVMRPGSFPLEENITVLKAISIAGGFTKFGSSSRVKILRQKQDGPGYDTLKINMDAVMNGNSKEDTLLKAGDIIVVSEGIF